MSEYELDMFQQVGAAAQGMCSQFTDPEDDWAPMAFMKRADDEQLGIMPLAQFMENVQLKDFLAEVVLPKVIREFNIVTVVFVFSAWTSVMAGKTMGTDHVLQPSQAPDRKEHLTLMEVTGEGATRFATAPIIRHKDKSPELGEWSDIATGGEGRFVDPVARAIRQVAV